MTAAYDSLWLSLLVKGMIAFTNGRTPFAQGFQARNPAEEARSGHKWYLSNSESSNTFNAGADKYVFLTSDSDSFFFSYNAGLDKYLFSTSNSDSSLSFKAGADKYVFLKCTDGCKMHYHQACWKETERAYREEHPQWKLKVPICFQAASLHFKHPKNQIG
jgi:hypothetical protein